MMGTSVGAKCGPACKTQTAIVKEVWSIVWKIVQVIKKSHSNLLT